jgi:hypothetical protein
MNEQCEISQAGVAEGMYLQNAVNSLTKKP